jgi:hypothetical protein
MESDVYTTCHEWLELVSSMVLGRFWEGHGFSRAAQSHKK